MRALRTYAHEAIPEVPQPSATRNREDGMSDITEDPRTWPDWLRKQRERAHAKLREARQQREAEREKSNSQQRGTKR